jgi:1,4-dihydroxy-2-naphthoate octaprenyltransferase
MRHWIEAARIRTLPLSVSGIIVGSMYALANPTDYTHPYRVFNWRIFSFAIITTLGLQILSFANDYGDGIKGTDNEDREGQKGDSKRITPKEMKGAIIITSLLTAILLIYFAFEDTNLYYSLF